MSPSDALALLMLYSMVSAVWTFVLVGCFFACRAIYEYAKRRARRRRRAA